MRTSLKGHQLPESFAEAATLEAQSGLRYTHCVLCKLSLSASHAAASPRGWAETQISGMCESCFDALFNPKDDPAVDAMFEARGSRCDEN